MKLLSLFFLLFSGILFAESDLYDRAKAYYYGNGVEQNYNKAFKAFSHADKAGDLAAKTALGLMYIEGKEISHSKSCQSPVLFRQYVLSRNWC